MSNKLQKLKMELEAQTARMVALHNSLIEIIDNPALTDSEKLEAIDARLRAEEIA